MTDEQLAYEHARAVGWNEAVKAATKIARKYSLEIASQIEKLDKSLSAIDNDWEGKSISADVHCQFDRGTEYRCDRTPCILCCGPRSR